MTGHIGTLGDRLLARLVPKARASAAYCRWYGCGGNACLVKYCCTGSGVDWCGNCQWSC